MDREAWRAAIHKVAKSWTRLSDWSDLIIKLYIFDNVYYYLYSMFATCWITLGIVCGVSVWSKIIRTCRGMICVSHSVVCNSLQPRDYSPPGPFVHYKQARILERVVIPFSRGFSKPGIEPGSPALQSDSLPSEPPGKPRGMRSSIVRAGLSSGKGW